MACIVRRRSVVAPPLAHALLRFARRPTLPPPPSSNPGATVEPQLSTPASAVYVREFEAQIQSEQVPLRQEFTVVGIGSAAPKVSLVVFARISSE